MGRQSVEGIMSLEQQDDLDSVLKMAGDERVQGLAAYGQTLLSGGGLKALSDEHKTLLVGVLTDIVKQGQGSNKTRLQIGELLGILGDPRLCHPSDSSYWSAARVKENTVQVGKFMVTNSNYRRFVDDGGYETREHWTDDGWEWLKNTESTWATQVNQGEFRPFLVPNQPVVGVSWFEASAFATAHGARLARFDERTGVVRGLEKRPYPWGSPFGEGNSNTQEEVLGRPCAVGLYLRDRTPEGVCDLAGNVAEWCSDGVGGEYWVHPGAWDQPSMAAWAKARVLENPSVRNAGLGFRLVKD